MEHWGEHRFVMLAQGWGMDKKLVGPIPIEIDEGWLLIFHGVGTTCNGMIYSMYAAILDKMNHGKITAAIHISSIQLLFMNVGDVPNVTFPCLRFRMPQPEELQSIMAAADTVVGPAFTQADMLCKIYKG